LGIRLVLSNRQWERIAPHSIGGERTRGSSGRDNRLFVERCCGWCAPGGPWRDFPEDFGPWNNVCPVEPGVWWRILEALSDDPDFAYLIVHYHSPRPPTRFGGEKGGLKIRPSAVPAVA
jgi:putative transposase